MKFYLILILLNFLIPNLLGQSFTTVDGIKINNIDKKGLKQGEWKLYRNENLALKCSFKEGNVIDTIEYYKDDKLVFSLEPFINNKQLWQSYIDSMPVKGYAKYNEDNLYRNYYIDETPTDSAMNWKLVEICEIYPEYYGGREKMYEYLSGYFSNLNLSGRVIVGFIINSNGEVKDIKIIESSNVKLNKIAIKAFKKMPRWQPGHQAGKMVSVRMQLPINL
jgi:TonB family protein